MYLVYGLPYIIYGLSFTFSTLILMYKMSPVGVWVCKVSSHATGILLRLASLACTPTLYHLKLALGGFAVVL